MAHVDGVRRLEVAQEAVDRETLQVAGERIGDDARQVPLHATPERHAFDAQQRIEYGAVEQRRPEAADQAIEALACTGRQDAAVVLGVQAKGAERGRSQVGVTGQLQRAPQLVVVLRITECGILVEPFGTQCFGREAEGLTAALVAHPHPGDHLPPLGDRDHAEAERQSQPVGRFEQLDAQDFDAGRGSHEDSSDDQLPGADSSVSIRPCR